MSEEDEVMGGDFLSTDETLDDDLFDPLDDDGLDDDLDHAIKEDDEDEDFIDSIEKYG
ncbi:MAG: hypothetical protein QG566_314 [Patescibacteria group bacterium]|nr:hypothetical protein [Patescibacteria group bacterium]